MRANVSAHPSFLTYRLQKVSSDITNLPTGARLTDGSIQVPLNSAQSINPVTLKYCLNINLELIRQKCIAVNPEIEETEKLRKTERLFTTIKLTLGWPMYCWR